MCDCNSLVGLPDGINRMCRRQRMRIYNCAEPIRVIMPRHIPRLQRCTICNAMDTGGTDDHQDEFMDDIDDGFQGFRI